jgi:putative tryptophan/tyrosine transport system substrate-binding protein
MRTGCPEGSRYLSGSWPTAHFIAALHSSLEKAGFVEGRNLYIEFRFAEGHYDRLPDLLSDLLHQSVALILATTSAAALVAAAATKTIPIVFISAGDPVKLGLVASYNRPGGNLTGVCLLSHPLAEKLFELVNEVVPRASLIGVLVNPQNPKSDSDTLAIQQTARVLGKRIELLHASSRIDLDIAFTTLARDRADALLVTNDPVFISQRDRVVSLTAQHAIPAIYTQREFADSGGLISYGTSITNAFQKLGVYAGLILKGAKPADLPVLQPTKFELVINLKTAKALGLEVSPSMIDRADEVIE